MHMYPEIEQFYEKYRYDKSKNKVEESRKIRTLFITEEFFSMGLLNYDEYFSIMNQLDGFWSSDLSSLNLSNRARNALSRCNISIFWTLRSALLNTYCYGNIFKVRNCGELATQEIIEKAIKFKIVTKEEMLEAKWDLLSEQKKLERYLSMIPE